MTTYAEPMSVIPDARLERLLQRVLPCDRFLHHSAILSMVDVEAGAGSWTEPELLRALHDMEDACMVVRQRIGITGRYGWRLLTLFGSSGCKMQSAKADQVCGFGPTHEVQA